jgi:hypothetical protein
LRKSDGQGQGIADRQTRSFKKSGQTWEISDRDVSKRMFVLAMIASPKVLLPYSVRLTHRPSVRVPFHDIEAFFFWKQNTRKPLHTSDTSGRGKLEREQNKDCRQTRISCEWEQDCGRGFKFHRSLIGSMAEKR